MNNILEAIHKLSENEDLKSNFLKEFENQVNWWESWDEKLKNYETFMNNKNTLELFLEEFDFDFIVEEIKKWFVSSNINQDLFTKKFFNNLDIYFYKKSFEWFNEERKKQVIELLNKFWELLRVFTNNHYNQNTILYKALQENLLILNIVFYIILWLLKLEEENLSEKIRTLFWINNNQNEGRIYQYWIFQKYDNGKFNQHLFIISLLVIFIENRTNIWPYKKADDYYWRNEDYNLVEAFKGYDLDNINIVMYLNNIKSFKLIDKFLENLEKKNWMNQDYRIKILLELLENNLLEKNELLDFSILFTKYEEVRKKYIEISSKINFSEIEILEKLNSDEIYKNEIINFLLIEWNEKYIKWKIFNKLIEIIKHKLKENLELDKIYFELYKNIINWKYWNIKLNLKLADFNEEDDNKLIKWIVEDINWFKFTLQNIEKFLVRKDIEIFYYELIKKYILDKIWVWEEFNILKIRRFFWFTQKDSFLERVLNQLTVSKNFFRKFWKTDDENHIIKRLSWSKRYKRIK